MQGIHPGFEIQSRCHQKSNTGISGPMKRTYVHQKLKKSKSVRTNEWDNSMFRKIKLSNTLGAAYNKFCLNEYLVDHNTNSFLHVNKRTSFLKVPKQTQSHHKFPYFKHCQYRSWDLSCDLRVYSLIWNKR